MTTPDTCPQCGLPLIGPQTDTRSLYCDAAGGDWLRQHLCRDRAIARMRPVVEAAVALGTSSGTARALYEAIEAGGFIPKPGDLGETPAPEAPAVAWSTEKRPVPGFEGWSYAVGKGGPCWYAHLDVDTYTHVMVLPNGGVSARNAPAGVVRWLLDNAPVGEL